MKIKRLPISSLTLKELFKNGSEQKFRVVSDGIPEDAEIIGTAYDAMTNVTSLMIRSETFAEVAEGQIVPAMHPLFERIA